MSQVSVVVPFDGPEAEKLYNIRSHQFGGIDGRCFVCDARPGSMTSAYECGGHVPRMVVDTTSPIGRKALGTLIEAVIGQEEE